MDTPRPRSAPASRIDRLVMWMRASTWRQLLVLYTVSMIMTAALLAAWIAVAYLRRSIERDAGAVALNLVLTGFVSTIGLFVMHRGIFRRFRRADRSGSKDVLPRIELPWMLRLRHAVIYIVGIVTLLSAFVPCGHQLAINGFLVRYSAGRSSAGSLAALVFGYTPIVILSLLAMALTHRQMRRRDAGLLDARAGVLLEAEINWLFAFAAAFVAALFLCRFGGSMIVAYL